MDSFFYLTLDTTGPEINIDSPSQSGTGGIVVTLTGNEDLSSEVPEVYFIDFQGVRTNYTLTKISDTSWEGTALDGSIASGVGTLYCIVKDDVLNPSELTSKEIEFIGGEVYIDGNVVKHIQLKAETPKTIQFLQGITELSIVNMGDNEVFFKLDDSTFDDIHDESTNYLNDVVRTIDIVKSSEFYTVTFVANGPTCVQWDGR